ncbi:MULTISPECIES: HEAT repeat domain-containing protein [Myxococcaceae]|uniref:HEAT repeat domain-containing protein n=1 Tax=Myxococcaceae TaxID=31 RepID=UPI00129CEE4B|nr:MULTISPECIES: HEAT repeat domain-containing protein [Myxococcaceae]
MSALVLALLFAAQPAPAAAPATRQAEADAQVDRVLAGEGVGAAVSRLQFLGMQGYAAGRLADAASAPSERTRRDVAYALSLLAAPEGERALVRLARDPDGAVRMSAAQGLGRLGRPHPEALLPLLADPTSGVRREAARALGALNDPRAGAALSAAARAEPDLDARAAMLVAVGQASDARQASSLRPFLLSSSESTRLAAARGLVLLGDRAGRDYAKALLGSQDRFVRRQGVSLFEGVPAARARPLLHPLLEDADRGLAAATARVLYQGGERAMLDWLVLASWNEKSSSARLAIERELEPLHLSDEARRAALRRAGVAP